MRQKEFGLKLISGVQLALPIIMSDRVSLLPCISSMVSKPGLFSLNC